MKILNSQCRVRSLFILLNINFWNTWQIKKYANSNHICNLSFFLKNAWMSSFYWKRRHFWWNFVTWHDRKHKQTRKGPSFVQHILHLSLKYRLEHKRCRRKRKKSLLGGLPVEYWTVLVPIHSLFLSSHLFHLPHILHFDLPSPQFQTTLPLSLFPSPLFNSPALPSLPPPLNSVYLQSFCSLIFLTISIPSSI